MTRRTAPRFAYASIAEEVLKGWDISLVFVGARRAKALNQTLRGKDYVPNVLSYESGEKSGEIIICIDRLKQEAPAFTLSPSHYCLYLFIHGLLHLKGHPHGTTMDRMERVLMARHAPVTTKNETTHSDRHRHRNAPDESRGGRRGARKRGR